MRPPASTAGLTLARSKPTLSDSRLRGRESPAQDDGRGAFASKGLIVNVTVENLAPCKKLLRVEVDAPAVDAAFSEITHEFQKQARLPGFRPGKSPLHLVVKAFAGQIDDEVKRKLLSESYRQAVAEQKLRVVGQPDFEEIQFARGQHAELLSGDGLAIRLRQQLALDKS